MAVVKNTNSDYLITCNNGVGNLVINADTEVFGNLSASCAFTVVASNNMGTMDTMGMLARTSYSSWAGLRFNTLQNRWEVSPSVTDTGAPIADYAPIGLGADGTPGGVNTAVQFNNDGAFDGSSAFMFDAVTNALTFSGYQYFVEQASDPAPVANAVALFGNVPASGNSGLFITGNTGPTQELITASQSLLYSIIF